MTTEHKSKSTISCYLSACANFFSWAGCGTLDCLDGTMVERYLTHLAVNRQVSASYQNQHFNALLYLFRMLGKDFGKINAERAKVAQYIPEWFTAEEIQLVFKELSGDWLLLAQLAYGTGMRLMELLRLRVKDCDFANGIILVRDGKGGKDRIVPLPKRLAADLKTKIQSVELTHKSDLNSGCGDVWLPGLLAKKYPNASRELKWQYLFPSRELCRAKGKLRRHHLFPNGFQTALKLAGQRLHFPKRVHPHALRHSFATAFLQNGGNLQMLQKLLGHKHIETTMLYTHCVDLTSARSPLDQLPLENLTKKEQQPG